MSRHGAPGTGLGSRSATVGLVTVPPKLAPPGRKQARLPVKARTRPVTWGRPDAAGQSGPALSSRPALAVGTGCSSRAPTRTAAAASARLQAAGRPDLCARETAVLAADVPDDTEI